MSDEDNNVMGPVMDATPEIQALAERPEIKEAAIHALHKKHHENKIHHFTEKNREKQLTDWQVTQYAEEQAAYGINYFMNVSIGNGLFIHIRVHRREDCDKVVSLSLNDCQKRIKKVRRSNGKYSCLTESTFNEYANGRLPCDTMRIGDNLNRKSYGTATALGSNLCADNMI
ncbi:unnamed protein product [Rotaria socialis]|uniref:Uncharacterized protein n=1 Tax=Rotaria socialis TaxID=392032 RepID=A0A818TJK2_9BILA|nr:unnamed protein product [Rotaria socialis]CAF4459645.1 unnamed protein product [Rotaria socialis]